MFPSEEMKWCGPGRKQVSWQLCTVGFVLHSMLPNRPLQAGVASPIPVYLHLSSARTLARTLVRLIEFFCLFFILIVSLLEFFAHLDSLKTIFSVCSSVVISVAWFEILTAIMHRRDPSDKIMILQHEPSVREKVDRMNQNRSNSGTPSRYIFPAPHHSLGQRSESK